MRPKKRVLVVDVDENRRSVTRYLLTTHGYAVLSASTVEDAIQISANDSIDLVLLDISIGADYLESCILKMKELAGFIPIMLTGGLKENMERVCLADAYVSRQIPRAELVERVRVMCARKRGPKPGVQNRIDKAQNKSNVGN